MLTVLLASEDDVATAEPRPPVAKSKGMTQVVSTVEQAVADAADALLRAEQDREAARTALLTADAGVDDAREVLDRLRRLHISLTGSPHTASPRSSPA